MNPKTGIAAARARLRAKRENKPTGLQAERKLIAKRTRLIGAAVNARHAQMVQRMHWLEQRAMQTRVGSHQRDVLSAEYVVLEGLVKHLESTFSDTKVA